MCSVADCGRELYARSLCSMHYQRLRLTGSVDRPSSAQRFWARVEKTAGCWLWGGTTSNGYGQLRREGHIIMAHRFSYQLVVGPIPEGLELDHLCRNPPCVNPAHLEPVTHGENMRRAMPRNRGKTHCLSGHPYSEDNTYTYPNGRRDCKICRRAASLRYARRARAA